MHCLCPPTCRLPVDLLHCARKRGPSRPCLHTHFPCTGGAIVDTGLCGGAAAAATDHPACLVLKGKNVITRNRATDGAGGGLLVTNTSTAFAECRGGEAPAAPLVPLQQCWAGAGTAGPAALAARGLPYGNQAKDPGTDDLASIAARLVVTCADGSRHDNSHDCRGSEEGRPQPAVEAPPGSTLRVVVEVQDWRGGRVLSGVDSAISLQVREFG